MLIQSVVLVYLLPLMIDRPLVLHLIAGSCSYYFCGGWYPIISISLYLYLSKHQTITCLITNNEVNTNNETILELNGIFLYLSLFHYLDGL